MEQQIKNCPYCGEEILAVAKKCKHCGEWLETKEEAKQVVETTEEKEAVSAGVTPKTEETPVSQQETEEPASEVAPVESYYTSNNVKLILGAIAAVPVILTIWFIVSSPEIEFDYIFGTLPYWLIFGVLGIFALFYFMSSFDEHRTSRVYLDSNGDLDIETPREYEPLSVSPISRFWGRENKFMQKNLDFFKYKDGRVLIRNSKWDEIEGALSDLTYTYQMNKNKMSDEWYVYKYIITDANGDKVQFNRHNSLFTDEEYADIEMLLSLAGTVKEAKVSKFNRMADSVVSAVKDLDFSNLKSAAVELAGSTATSKLTDAAGLIAKKRIFDRLSEKKKSLLKRIFEYILLFIFALYVLAVIWVNVEKIINANSSSSEETEYNYEQSYEQNNSGNESEVVEVAPTIDEDILDVSDYDAVREMSGEIGRYPIEMTIKIKDFTRSSQCEVVGKYHYTSSGDGGYLYLSGQLDGNRLILTEYGDDGITGKFDGILDVAGTLRLFVYEGTFYTSQGKEFAFELAE